MYVVSELSGGEAHVALWLVERSVRPRTLAESPFLVCPTLQALPTAKALVTTRRGAAVIATDIPALIAPIENTVTRGVSLDLFTWTRCHSDPPFFL